MHDEQVLEYVHNIHIYLIDAVMTDHDSVTSRTPLPTYPHARTSRATGSNNTINTVIITETAVTGGMKRGNDMNLILAGYLLADRCVSARCMAV